MFDWLIPWFARGYSGVKDLAASVRDAVKQALDALVAMFIRWALAFVYIYQAFIALALATWFLGRSLVDALFRVGYVWLPNAVAKGLNDAITVARTELMDIRAALLGEIHNAVLFAVDLFNRAVDFARTGLAALGDLAARTWALAWATAQRVVLLLTDPRALADWIAGNIIQAVFRWAVGNASALARLGFQWAIRGATFGAALAEQVIADLFL